MSLKKMKRKTYFYIIGGFFATLFLMIIAGIGVEFALWDGLWFLLLYLAAIVQFVICIVKGMKTPRQWKKKFLENHPQVVSVTFLNCFVVELDGLKPTVIDLNKERVAFRGALITEFGDRFSTGFKSKYGFGSKHAAKILYRAFYKGDGLELPFTFGSRNGLPVHYISEGEHKAVLSIIDSDNDTELDFSFHVWRGRKYEIFYDWKKQGFDMKDTTGDKEMFSSWI